jgi:hypothetical protein
MRRPAKTRLAGTIAAIPLCVLLAGVATSQTVPSPVLNDQLNLGDIFAGQVLNVVTVEEGVSAVTTAGANTMGMTVDGADGDLRSNQVNSGAVLAHGVVNVDGSTGSSSNVTSTAVGNGGTATAAGGTFTGFMVQTNSGPVTARSQVEAEYSHANDMTIGSQAAGNSQGLLLVNGAMGARVSQANSGDVLADGGAIIQHVTGTAIVAGTAAGNNIDLEGANQSAARIITDQGNTAATVQASKFTAYGNSYMTATAATASGNNLSAQNEGTLLDVAAHQYNTAYVRAQAEETSYQFGGAQVSAYGVGNSVLAGNFGPGLVLDNVQVNDGGGVEVIATFDGHSGYDGGASATAMGNAVTGYVCNQCSGAMDIANSQANYVDVSARSTVRVGGNGRSIAGVSTATGNNATFSVTSSGH